MSTEKEKAVPVMLHRFPGDVRHNINLPNEPDKWDVIVVERDGTIFVLSCNDNPSSRGSSLFEIFEKFYADFHIDFNGQFKIVVPNQNYSSDFDLRCHRPYFKTFVREDGSIERKKVGHHYSLAPLKEMPLGDYTSTLHNLAAVLCNYDGGGEVPKLPFNGFFPPPIGPLVALVVMALKHFFTCSNDDIDLKVAAKFAFNDILSSHLTYEHMLTDLELLRIVRVAWKSYLNVIDRSDPVRDSDCYIISTDLGLSDESSTPLTISQ